MTSEDSVVCTMFVVVRVLGRIDPEPESSARIPQSRKSPFDLQRRYDTEYNTDPRRVAGQALAG